MEIEEVGDGGIIYIPAPVDQYNLKWFKYYLWILGVYVDFIKCYVKTNVQTDVVCLKYWIKSY